MTNNQKHQTKLEMLQKAYETNIDYLGESGREYQTKIMKALDHFEKIEDKEIIQEMLYAQYNLVLETMAKSFDFGYILTKVKQLKKGKGNFINI